MQNCRFALAAFAAALLSGCATPPEKIAAAPMPAGAYAGLSCKELDTEHFRVQQQLSIASNAQQKAVTGDAWGVFLIGVPLSSMSGGDRETEVAIFKGQVEAINQERVRKDCANRPAGS